MNLLITSEMKKILLTSALLLIAGSMTFAAPRTTEIVESAPSVATKPANGKFIKRKVAIGRFSNETQYAKGIFYDKENDPMGKQALDILSSKLAASGKFLLLERNDIASLLAESQKDGGSAAATIGADYIIVGSVTQFGRKNVGKEGVFSNTSTQMVEAAVSVRLVEVSTGMIIYSDEGHGEAELTSKTTLGFGSKAGFDASLSDKAISAAISQLVENIINKCTDKPWRTYFISVDTDATLIAGGNSQGVAVGDTFKVLSNGKKVKNPQTGVMIELPGKEVGTVTVLATGGDTPETQYSFVQYSGTTAITSDNMSNYYITQ